MFPFRRSRSRCAPAKFRSRTSAANYFNRTVRFEPLEDRYALSADVGMAIDVIPSDPSQEDVQPAVAPAEPTFSESASGSADGFVGPLELDDYFASISSPPAETISVTAEGEGGTEPPSGAAPPVLLSFTGSRFGMYWVLSGYVSDDLPPPNCYVELGGVFAGRHLSVASNGYFSTFLPYNPNQAYEVPGIAHDSNGNVSNIITVVLMP